MDYQEYKIQIKLFGSLQLENQYGVMKEPNRDTASWLILKYLLVNRGREVSQEEMLDRIWQENTKDANGAFCVRLSRLRSSLKEIKLGGKKGLVLSDNGRFALNPEYDIETDAMLFDIFMERIRNISLNVVEGLVLCVGALNLYRGPFLERTDAVWAEDLRRHYHDAFLELVSTTLNRMKTLDDTCCAAVLSSRVAAILPTRIDLQEEIKRVVAEAKNPVQLVPAPKNTGNVASVLKSVIQVKLFGLLEVENQNGRMGESAGQVSQPLLLLKYLLVNRGREVPYTELMEKVWERSRIDADQNGESTIRVYLSRLRQLLKPLRLDGKHGLVSHAGGFYGLNPDVEIQTDEELFWHLMEKIQKTPSDDPQGLHLCMEALELYRGKYLENTEDSPWLLERRDRYMVEFCFLACSALDRMETLKETSAISLLSQRSVAIAPEEEPLHKEIIRFMIEHNLQGELLRHISQLVRDQSMEAGWLMGQGGGDTGRIEEPASEWIYSEQDVRIREFGVLALDNQWGHAEEKLGRGRLDIDEDRPRMAWNLLKYLLINRGREVPQDELIEKVWPIKPDADEKNVCELRRRRMRENLEALRLHGQNGLILFSGNGLYSLNPEYNLITDEDLFAGYMEQVRSCSVEDPAGLEACTKALELYRGEFMQYTTNAPWLIQSRKHYYDEFCHLVHDTLRRMKTLGNSDAVGLLSRRVAAFMPKANELHMELISYMVEQNRQDELEQFIALLTRQGGEGPN